MLYQIKNIENDIIVAEYESENPIPQENIDPLYSNQSIYKTFSNGLEITVPTIFKWTRLEFLRRFTTTERVTIREAAKSSPAIQDFWNSYL